MKGALLGVLFAASTLAVADNGVAVDQIDAILTDASVKRWEARSKVDREYRAAVATAFKFADRVEIFLLDLSMGSDAAYAPKEGDAVFPIRPYDKETKILKTHTVPTKDVPKWCEAVTKLIASNKAEGVGAMCHYPVHGIRIHAGERLLFETSVCWGCGNYYFTYEGDSQWVGLNEDALDLSKLLETSMPIPDSERKRFPGGEAKVK